MQRRKKRTRVIPSSLAHEEYETQVFLILENLQEQFKPVVGRQRQTKETGM